MRYKKLARHMLIALLVGAILAGITYQFTLSKYPPCDLVTKGIGVSTYGCVNLSETANYACKNMSANSTAMLECVASNYYRYKTVPFGFKQRFNDKSNILDKSPMAYNAILMFTSSFLVTLLGLWLMQRYSKKRTSR